MEKLVRLLKRDYPQFTFVVGETLCWSPAGDKIFYQNTDSESAMSGLLHELAHATLNHQTYTSDLDLLQKEIAAWQHALSLANAYTITIDPNHAEDCLDTYRDWLHKRSTCPICHNNGMQQQPTSYNCLNCGHTWHVSASRASRPYRLSNIGQRKRAEA